MKDLTFYFLLFTWKLLPIPKFLSSTINLTSTINREWNNIYMTFANTLIPPKQLNALISTTHTVYPQPWNQPAINANSFSQPHLHLASYLSSSLQHPIQTSIQAPKPSLQVHHTPPDHHISSQKSRTPRAQTQQCFPCIRFSEASSRDKIWSR